VQLKPEEAHVYTLCDVCWPIMNTKSYHPIKLCDDKNVTNRVILFQMPRRMQLASAISCHNNLRSLLIVYYGV
jgi:hypothetical protein